jgi:hypothetical protein
MNLINSKGAYYRSYSDDTQQLLHTEASLPEGILHIKPELKRANSLRYQNEDFIEHYIEP